MAHATAGTAHSRAVVDIAIITILPEEYESVLKQLESPKRDPGSEEQPNQYAWVLGEIPCAEGGRYRVVLAMAGNPGTTSGSLVTRRTITRWHPRYVLLVGIAGGLAREGLSLGDVVVSSVIRAYEYGKIHKGRFEPRPDFQYRVDGSLYRNALSLKSTLWQRGLKRSPVRGTSRPKVLAGPIASGDKVVDDVGAEFFAAVKRSFPRLLAVEMEGAGVAAAIEESQEEGINVGFLMVRGISDMPPATTGKKQRTSARQGMGGTQVRDRWKQYATDVAASFAVQLVAHAWPVPPQGIIDEEQIESVHAHKREEARVRYFQYLEAECGEIQLDGLPADEEIGSRRLALEKLFVPLHVVRFNAEIDQDVVQLRLPGFNWSENTKIDERRSERRYSFGGLLTTSYRIALLAPPGGGKSTMLKRLALAYAFPERRQQLDDKLPARQWLPLLIRCRELKARATEPFSEILVAIAERAEMKQHAFAFRAVIDAALADRSLLLLIDGLDEISDEGARSAFVQQLHVFLELHPDVGVVVTSRESGFRLVARKVATMCRCYRLAEFDDADITRLTVAWHREVVGDRQRVLAEAQTLAVSICQTDRVRRLARNPLLLTTLLLVRRWVGELPQRRAVLYQKAIEVLLMSWNTAAHEKLEASEALPQLGFLAFKMMRAGLQQISERKLRAILEEARQQMADIYAYARIGIDEFIRRVEHRSSLLVQSGHTFEEGRLWPLYEFRHLTFQEYLAAHAVAEGHYPARQESDTVLSVLQPYLDQPSWKEVIPLASVLAERHAKPLVEHLTERCERECRHSTFYHQHDRPVWNLAPIHPAGLLAQCLIDEVPLLPALAERALLALACAHVEFNVPIEMLARGRYRETLERLLKSEMETNSADFQALGSAMARIGFAWWRERLVHGEEEQAVQQLERQLQCGTSVEKARAALIVMKMAHSYNKLQWTRAIWVGRLLPKLELMLQAPQHFLYGAAMWVYFMLFARELDIESIEINFLPRIFELWIQADTEELRDLAAMVITELPLLERNSSCLPQPTTALLEWLINEGSHADGRREIASLVVAYYWRRPWSDDRLRETLVNLSRGKETRAYRQLIVALGVRLYRS